MTPVKEQLQRLEVVVQQSENNSKALCDQLKNDCELLKEENKTLIKKVERLEFFQRRNNLKVFGLKEEKNEDIDEKLVAILNSCLAPTVSFNNRTFERVHRLGRFSDKTTRPVIARFAHYKDKILSYNAARQLRTKQIYLSDDYPGKMADNRQKLSPIYNALRNMKTTMESSHVKTLTRKQDTILLNGKTYDMDTLEQLPDALNLKTIFTPSKAGITTFFSKHSPLSNFYQCQFEVNGVTFDNMERFLSIRKAELFRDAKAIEDIKKQTDPAAVKTIAKKVSGFKAPEWEANIMRILDEGLWAKFEQNEHLARFLLNTGTDVIAEANKYDSLCAVGLGLFDKNVWDTSKWQGKNEMGKALMRVRDKLRDMQDQGIYIIT